MRVSELDEGVIIYVIYIDKRKSRKRSWGHIISYQITYHIYVILYHITYHIIYGIINLVGDELSSAHLRGLFVGEGADGEG